MEMEKLIVGIKELVDDGLREVPPIYVRPPNDRPTGYNSVDDTNLPSQVQMPIIDISSLLLGATEDDPIAQPVIQQIAHACKEWGFFQVVNHGVSHNIIQDLRDAALKFFQLPAKERMCLNNQFFGSSVSYSTSFNPKYEKVREWKDTLSFCRFPGHCDGFQEAPTICKEQVLKYVGAVEMVAQILYKSILTSLEFNGELFSNFAPKISRVIMGINYYPTCPDPSLTLGLSGHSDVGFLTILHPSEVPGLQIKYKGDWVSVFPVHESAFVVNIADQVEILSNGKYKSIEHRVVTNRVKPRMSIACFFAPPEDTIVAPLPALLDEKNPPLYKATKFADYLHNFSTSGLFPNRGTLDFVRI